MAHNINITSVIYISFFLLYVSGLNSYLSLIGYPIISTYLVIPFMLFFFIIKFLKNEIFLNWKILYAIGFLGLNLSYYAFYSSSEDSFLYLVSNITSVIIFLMFAFSLNENTMYLLKKIIPFLLIFSCLINIADFIRPQLFLDETSEYFSPGRAHGFFLNPNQSGSTIVLFLAFTLSFCKPRVVYLCIFFAAVGVFLTFSRSSWLLLFLCLLIFRNYFNLKIFTYGILFLLIFITLLGFFALQSQDNIFLLANYFIQISERLDLFSIFADSSISETDQIRLSVAEKSFSVFEDNLFFGNGYAYTMNWFQGTHNMHFLFIVEMGLLGYIFYFVSYFYFALQSLKFSLFDSGSITKLYTFAFLYLLIFGLFSHNIFTTIPSVAMIAIFAFVKKNYFFKDRNVFN